MDIPFLSVVVAIVSDTNGHADTAHLEACLEALSQQPLADSTEIIVPFYPGVTGITALKARYPKVDFLEVTNLKTYTGQSSSREHHGELQARGIAAARGRVDRKSVVEGKSVDLGG